MSNPYVSQAMAIRSAGALWSVGMPQWKFYCRTPDASCTGYGSLQAKEGIEAANFPSGRLLPLAMQHDAKLSLSLKSHILLPCNVARI